MTSSDFRFPAVITDMIEVSIGQYANAMANIQPTMGGYTTVTYNNCGEPTSCQSFDKDGRKISYRVSRSVWLRMKDPK